MEVDDEQMEALRALARKGLETNKRARQVLLEAKLTQLRVQQALLESELRIAPYRHVIARAKARVARRGF